MKKFKGLLRVCAALLVLGMLAGCTGDAPSSQSSSSSESSESAGSAREESSSQENGESGEPVDTSVILPLTEEKVTLTLWTPMDGNSVNVIDSMGESEFFKQLEERTNVHIEFQHPATGNEASAYNLMIAGGELPDMIKNGSGYMYPDGLDAAVEDGYYMDITNLLPQYAPNYLKAVDNYNSFDPDFKKAVSTNEGRMVGIYQIMTEPQGPFCGLYVRKDWLDDCKLETPVTYEDWETMLTAFKDQKGATAPLLLPSTGYDVVNHSLSAGWGVSDGFYQEEGVVKYGPIEEGWKNYITMLNRWYSKGLIDPDFMSSTSIWPDNAMVTTGKTGAFISMYTLIAMYEGANETPNAEYIPVAAPKVNPEDKVKLNAGGLPVGGYITISADSPNAEMCLRWLDYLFTEEGSLFANYGVEGDTFEFVNGVPTYTDKITHNDAYSFSQAMAIYSIPPARVCLQDWKRELAAVPEKDIISYEIWPEATYENTVPDVSAMGITTEENTEYAKIMADVKSIVDEKTSQFITGAVTLDEYDGYLAQLEQQNIARAIEIVQTVYDRFKAR